MRLPTSLVSSTRAGWLLLFGLLFASSPVAAQNGTVRGTVTQSGTDQPLVGVIVTVTGTGIRAVTTTGRQL